LVRVRIDIVGIENEEHCRAFIYGMRLLGCTGAVNV